MADKPALKKFSVTLPMAEYERFTALGDQLGYTDLKFGEILICYAIPHWPAAVQQRTDEVKARMVP